jgi:hypothetical protein
MCKVPENFCYLPAGTYFLKTVQNHPAPALKATIGNSATTEDNSLLFIPVP